MPRRGGLGWGAAAIGAVLSVGCNGSPLPPVLGSTSGEDSGVVDAAAPDVTTHGESGAPSDGSTVTPDGGFVEGPHTPTIIPYQGGPVIAAPLVVTISFAGDSQRANEEQVDAYLATSPWLATVGKEYGVGTGSNVDVELTQSAPTTLDMAQIPSFIAALVTSGAAPDPVADAGANAKPSAVYMLFVPSGTTVTDMGADICTISSGAYHAESTVAVNGHPFTYAVVSNCSSANPLDGIVHNASHELIEACTDPYRSTAPAYTVTDTSLPASFGGGEVADLCTYLAPQWSEGGFTNIQRVYSNASAKAGGPLCVPTPEPWFGADVEPKSYVTVAAGQSTTFQLSGWSSAPVAQWYVAASSLLMPDAGSFAFASPWMQNGQSNSLQVTVPPGVPSGTYVDIEVFAAHSQSDYTTELVGVHVQ